MQQDAASHLVARDVWGTRRGADEVCRRREHHVESEGKADGAAEPTGLLVPIEQADDGSGTPLDPERYVADFAEALTSLVTDPDRAAAMGRAGRRRAVESFGWPAIAERTMEVYRSVL